MREIQLIATIVYDELRHMKTSLYMCPITEYQGIWNEKVYILYGKQVLHKKYFAASSLYVMNFYFLDIDECEGETHCPLGALCTNVLGSYQCTRQDKVWWYEDCPRMYEN